MYYTQATIGRIQQDVVTYWDSLNDAIKAAKRQAKDADYTAVWYGHPERMEARIQVK